MQCVMKMKGGSQLGVATEVRRQYRNRVLLCRLKAGIKTCKKLAELTRIPCSTLCEIESNKRFLTAPFAIRIARALGVTMDELYEEIPGRKDRNSMSFERTE